MNELSNWKELAKGLYRYIIADNICYEIYILYHTQETDILTAKANLYLVGNWYSMEKHSYFERELLLSKQSVFECLNVAERNLKASYYSHYKRMMGLA